MGIFYTCISSHAGRMSQRTHENKVSAIYPYTDFCFLVKLLQLIPSKKKKLLQQILCPGVQDTSCTLFFFVKLLHVNQE